MKKIYACVDTSAMTPSVCDGAAWLADKLELPLVLLHTIEKPVTGSIDMSGSIGPEAGETLLQSLTEADAAHNKSAKEQSKRLLASLEQRLTGHHGTVTTLERFGDINASLMEMRDTMRAYVMGRCGEDHLPKAQEIQKAHIPGSHIENALRTIDRAMLLTIGEFKTPKSFLLAYDGREKADQAIERLLETGLLSDCDCHVVSVANQQAASQTKFSHAVACLEGKFRSITPHFIASGNITSGSVAEVLLARQLALDVDLTVMGAFAHSKVRQFFVGSNTLKLISGSKTPLLIIR